MTRRVGWYVQRNRSVKGGVLSMFRMPKQSGGTYRESPGMDRPWYGKPAVGGFVGAGSVESWWQEGKRGRPVSRRRLWFLWWGLFTEGVMVENPGFEFRTIPVESANDQWPRPISPAGNLRLDVVCRHPHEGVNQSSRWG